MDLSDDYTQLVNFDISLGICSCLVAHQWIFWSSVALWFHLTKEPIFSLYTVLFSRDYQSFLLHFSQVPRNTRSVYFAFRCTMPCCVEKTHTRSFATWYLTWGLRSVCTNSSGLKVDLASNLEKTLLPTRSHQHYININLHHWYMHIHIMDSSFWFGSTSQLHLFGKVGLYVARPNRPQTK